MGILANPKHEAFVRSVATGKGVADSYSAMYPDASRQSCITAGSALLNTPECQSRLTELMIAGAEKTETTIERIVQEIERLALVDVREIFDADGGIKSPKEWSAELGAQVAGMQVDEKTDTAGNVTRTYKVKFWDKNAALALLAKHRGMIVERSQSLNVNIGVNVDVRVVQIDMKPEDAADLYAMTIGN